MTKTDDKDFCLMDHFCGAATAGESGQIVILGHTLKKGLMPVKIDAMGELMHTPMTDLQQLDRQIQNGEKTDDKAEETAS